MMRCGDCCRGPACSPGEWDRTGNRGHPGGPNRGRSTAWRTRSR
ncbi:hypothetical protein ACFFX0_20440 [Citricoccus parietis]|uniref:Uncharacterized protein n=1 Tax=Citricoccus parietis TaxID=592307 RepID=A0ABV5G3C4_9MICC